MADDDNVDDDSVDDDDNDKCQGFSRSLDKGYHTELMVCTSANR